jgi:hypothetical protein
MARSQSSRVVVDHRQSSAAPDVCLVAGEGQIRRILDEDVLHVRVQVDATLDWQEDLRSQEAVAEPRVHPSPHADEIVSGKAGRWIRE